MNSCTLFLCWLEQEPCSSGQYFDRYSVNVSSPNPGLDLWTDPLPQGLGVAPRARFSGLKVVRLRQSHLPFPHLLGRVVALWFYLNIQQSAFGALPTPGGEIRSPSQLSNIVASVPWKWTSQIVSPWSAEEAGSHAVCAQEFHRPILNFGFF